MQITDALFARTKAKAAPYVVALCLFGLISPTAATAPTDPLVIGGSGSTSFAREYVNDLSNVIRKNHRDLRIAVRPTGGSVDNLRRLEIGELDMSLVALGALRERYVAQSPPAISALIAPKPFPMLLVVRASLNKASMTSVSGLRIAAPAGSYIRALSEDVLRNLNVKVQWQSTSWDQIGYMLRSGQADGFVASYRTLGMIQSEYGTPPLKVIGLTSDEARKLKDLTPELETVRLDDNEDQTITWAARMILVVRNVVDDRKVDAILSSSRILPHGTSHDTIRQVDAGEYPIKLHRRVPASAKPN